jgi:tetratricopeptide (TPR) repeat protein
VNVFWKYSPVPETLMTTTLTPESVVVPANDLRHILALYQQGLCLQAYERAQMFGPLATWASAPARVLAGRLAVNLGAPKLAYWLHLRAWRADRGDPEARYFYGRSLFERRGPLAAWKFLQRLGDMPDAPAEVRADWLAFHAYVLGRLRDFDAAENWLARAEEVCPGRPWVSLERAYLLELEDRYEESLAAARRSLELRPWYRPGVQATAHALQLLNRDREAIDLLTEADRRIESGPVMLQLAGLQTEQRRYADAGRSYDRFRELSPLLEKDMAEWVAARQSDVAYYCGDDPRAAEFARQVTGPFYPELAKRLETTPRPGKRVLLDVRFVRQHHQTCAPATLAAISRFWDMPAEHLDVAAAICYDGTPDHRERHWAEANGWIAREFTVTWESAVALIERGVPFTLTTIEPGSAHLQAVIGYDSCRGTLLIRDPYLPQFTEFIADTMLERYKSTGPRGMVLVPRDRAGLLDGITLPDAEAYDHLHRLQCLLQEHNRFAAAAAAARMTELAPGHRLTLQGRRVLALYDADRAELLASVESLLQLFPEDALLLAAKLACLRELGRRDERLTLLRAVCARKECDPIFWRQLAQELLPDAREHPAARRWLQRALRCNPMDAGHLATLANLHREQRCFADALELDRFTACLDDKDEGLAQTYFWTARQLKQTETALDFLKKRFQRFGVRSGQPTRTLFWAYGELERMTEAFAVLDEGLKLRPNDGDLLLYTADAHTGHGNFEQAGSLLTAAEGHCPRPAWLRTAARLAESRGEPKAALELWRQVAAAEPLSVPAHGVLARLLAETEGRAAALDHLRAVCERFPTHYGLLQLWITWLREDGPTAVEPVVRRLLEVHPADAWARRELALALGDQARYDEAFAELELARSLEPLSAAYWAVRGQVCEQAGQRGPAQDAYRETIRLSADHDFAFARLMDLCETLAERRAVLAFVEQEFIRQVIFGDGLLAYQHHAQRTLEPEEVLASLRKALDARPDLWHAWSAVVRQLVEMGRFDEAFEGVQQATARFPLLPRLWLDRAFVCRDRDDHDGEKAALRQALQINPGFGAAIRELVEVHRREDQYDEARAVLEQSFIRNPLDPVNHGCLADMLHQRGDIEGAVEQVQKALRLDPGYDWAWRSLRSWSAGLGKPHLAAQFARELTERRAGEARSWLMLADTLATSEQNVERLAALDQALRLNPHSVEACDLKAELLARMDRPDEALVQCRALGEPLPLLLRGRAAWIEWHRDNGEEAIRLMREAVTDDPAYYWGWSQLADWYRQGPDNALYLEAAEHLARLAPESCTALGTRGEAKLRGGDRAGAKEDFRKAVEAAPDYVFGALHLFDQQLDDEEWDAAAATLELLKTHADDEFVCAREVQLTARLEDPLRALECLRRLTTWKTEATWPLETAVGALLAAGRDEEVLCMLREAVDSPDVHPLVGRLWIERCLAREDWSAELHLEPLLARGEVGRYALEAWVRGVGEAKQGVLLRRCLERYREPLRAKTSAWGTAGYALTTVLDPGAASAWLADWADRPDAEPWMLINLVIALRSLGRHDEANRVGHRALELKPDHTSRYHSVWLAADEAVAGDTAAARERLRPLGAKTFDVTHRYLHMLIEATLEMQEATPAERPALFDGLRQRLSAADEPIPAEDRRAVVAVYRRSVRRLARDCRGVWAWLWGVWRWIEPRVPPAR